jgi:hypothetical protein
LTATATPQTTIAVVVLLFLFFYFSILLFQTPTIQHPATTTPHRSASPNQPPFRSLTTTIE